MPVPVPPAPIPPCTDLAALQSARTAARTSREAIYAQWAGVSSQTADFARGQAVYAAVIASTSMLHHVQLCPSCRTVPGLIGTRGRGRWQGQG